MALAEGMTRSDIRRWRAKVRVRDDGCHEWTSARSGFGHGQFRLNGKTVGAHRLAWRMGNGWAEIPRGLVVRHRCHRAACVNPEHLELGAQADNVADMIDAGRAVVGEKHPSAKLTNEAVLEAREKYAAGEHDITALGRMYGVTDMVMRDVLLGRTWRHITGGTAVHPPKPVRLTQEDKDTIIRLRRDGWTQASIAAHVGRPMGTIVRILHAAGIKQDRPGRPRVDRGGSR